MNLDVFNNLDSTLPNLTNNDFISELTSRLRELRNDCINPDFRSELTNNASLVSNCVVILSRAGTLWMTNEGVDKDTTIVCIRVGVQFLANLAVDNGRGQCKIWAQFECLRPLFDINDEKLRDYLALLVHTCVVGEPERASTLIADTALVRLLVQEASTHSDLTFILIENLVKLGFLEQIYSTVSPKLRLFLLEVIHAGFLSKRIIVDEGSVRFLKECFKDFTKTVTESQNWESDEPMSLCKLVTVMSAGSGSDEFQAVLQADEELLISAVKLLGAVKNGLEGGGDQGPGHGLKADLIQLIGNLAYRNKRNQDVARSLDCIPMVLDSCRIDPDNPFITEWAVLAIRNLLEGNPENQAVVAATEGRSLLLQHGVVLDSAIGIAPVTKKPS